MAMRTAAVMPGFPICAAIGAMSTMHCCNARLACGIRSIVVAILRIMRSRASRKVNAFSGLARRSVKHGMVCATSVLQFPAPSSNSRYSTSSRQVNTACAEALRSNATNRALQSPYSTRETRASKSSSAVSPAGFHAYCAPNIMPGTAMRGSLTCPKSPQSVTSMPSAPQSMP